MAKTHRTVEWHIIAGEEAQAKTPEKYDEDLGVEFISYVDALKWGPDEEVEVEEVEDEQEDE